MAQNKPAFLSGNKGGGAPMHPPYENRNDNQKSGTGENKDTVVDGGKSFLDVLPVSKDAAKTKKPFGKMSEPSGYGTDGVGSVGDVD